MILGKFQEWKSLVENYYTSNTPDNCSSVLSEIKSKLQQLGEVVNSKLNLDETSFYKIVFLMYSYLSLRSMNFPSQILIGLNPDLTSHLNFYKDLLPDDYTSLFSVDENCNLDDSNFQNLLSQIQTIPDDLTIVSTLQTEIVSISQKCSLYSIKHPSITQITTPNIEDTNYKTIAEDYGFDISYLEL